jgi:hypothetical protein
MRSLSWLIAGLCLLPAIAAADEKVDRRCLELKVGEAKYQGRQLYSDNEVCWLLEKDGRLRNIELSEVTGYRQVSSVYKPFSQNELRPQLLKEFGRTFEVATRGHHLVVAPLGKAKLVAEILEKTSLSFVSYFTRRNLKLDKVEAPLVTIVFQTQEDFQGYCQQENVKRTLGLRGFYSPTTNRVALYLEQSADAKTRSSFGDISLGVTGAEEVVLAPFRRETIWGAPQGPGSVADTLVHETTHQMGFNTGLHSRLGDDPTWVVEGLAMLFEGDANRDDEKAKTTVNQRINRERFVWFQEYKKLRRKPKSLEDFLTSDSRFDTATLDAYSESWALMFFLAETRASQLSGYLKKLAYRTELGEYTPMRRLDDFKAAFGKDIPHLEAQYLKFIEDLEAPPADAPATKPTLEQELSKANSKRAPVTLR